MTARVPGPPPGATRRVRPGPRSTDRPVRLTETRATSPPQATVRPDPSTVQLTTPRRFARAIDRQTPSAGECTPRRSHRPLQTDRDLSGQPRVDRSARSTLFKSAATFFTDDWLQLPRRARDGTLGVRRAPAPPVGAGAPDRAPPAVTHRLKVRYGNLAAACITSLPGTPRRHLWSPLPGHVDATRAAAAVGI